MEKPNEKNGLVGLLQHDLGHEAVAGALIEKAQAEQ
jgi:hypothetical protein